MKAKDKKIINLSLLSQKLSYIKRKQDSKLDFEITHTLFVLINLLNINIALYGTSYFNYNYSLLIFNALFLSRKTVQSLYTFCSIRSTTLVNLMNAPLYTLLMIYGILIVHCLTILFFHYSFNVLLNLICPFTAYQFLAYSAMSSRYSDGSVDCFYSLQQISLNSLEILYCAGYLPYKFFPSSGYYLNMQVFMNSLLVMFLCDTIFHFGEFMKKRSAELMFFAHSQGDWKKCDEMASEEWQSDKTYNRGDVVKHRGYCWKGIGKYNNCEPGKYETYILTFLFKDPQNTMKRINLITAISAGIHSIYLVYLPFQYSQIVSVLIFAYVLIRNIIISKHLKLPNI